MYKGFSTVPRYKKQLVALKELINETEDVPERYEIADVLRLKRIWHDLTGKKIAAITSPYRLNKGVLHIAVHEQIWLAEFPYLKKDMILKIKEAGIELSDIRFKLSFRKVSTARAVEEKASPLTEEQKVKIGKLSANINNGRIRDAYADAFAAYLRRKQV